MVWWKMDPKMVDGRQGIYSCEGGSRGSRGSWCAVVLLIITIIIIIIIIIIINTTTITTTNFMQGVYNYLGVYMKQTMFLRYIVLHFLYLQFWNMFIIINIIIIIITTTTTTTFMQVFQIIYLKQTMLLLYTVLQLFCIYNLCYM